MSEAGEEKPQFDKKDIEKILGSPKIIFVLGGPASGKGTQCEKLVEEFGYTHISTGDLMRAEMKKVSELTNSLKLRLFTTELLLVQGTKEGEQISKIVGEGGLVPFELTVQVLINALISNPSSVSAFFQSKNDRCNYGYVFIFKFKPDALFEC